MIILITAFTILHVLFYIKLTLEWRKIADVNEEHESFIPFSVVIPVRNEEASIERILQKLDSQQYPKDLFEVIIVDDFSDDQTVPRVNQLIEALDINIRLIRLTDRSRQGKKHALTAAVEAANFETILTTDADCWFGDQWIHACNDAFEDGINMVAGPVAIQGKGLFARLQQVEFAGLMGFGAVTISKENPSMCSGAKSWVQEASF